MTEREFWTALEFRVTRELGRLSDNLRFLWCDGFLPDPYQPDDGIIVGDALISEDDGRTFVHYRFRFSLQCDLGSDRGLGWETELPPESEHDWLTVDRDQKVIEILRKATI